MAFHTILYLDFLVCSLLLFLQMAPAGHRVHPHMFPQNFDGGANSHTNMQNISNFR